jgi:hypothetical protein
MTIDADAVAPCEGAARHRVDRRFRFGVASERVGTAPKTLAWDDEQEDWSRLLLRTAMKEGLLGGTLDVSSRRESKGGPCSCCTLGWI